MTHSFLDRLVGSLRLLALVGMVLAVAWTYPVMADDPPPPSEAEVPDLNYYTNNNVLFYENGPEFCIGNECNRGTPGIFGNIIVDKAHELAWENDGYGKNREDATPQYSEQCSICLKWNNDTWSDCGVFVATVMQTSGADPNYPDRGTGIQLNYIRNHPELYDVYDNFNTEGEMMPGDILVYNSGDQGHTYIYVGPYTAPDGERHNSMSASWHSDVPQGSHLYFVSSGGHHFTVARLKALADTTSGVEQ